MYFEDYEEIQEMTRKMFEKQNDCLHLHQTSWAVFDDWYVSLEARNGQNIPMSFIRECLDCGKRLN